MAYNIVRKGNTVCLVSKGRGGEHYLASFGSMPDAEFKAFQKDVHDLPQEDRIAYCTRTKKMIEQAEDMPRRKAPTGDIREQPIKKEKKVRKQKKTVEKEIIAMDDRPKTQSTTLEKETIEGMPLHKFKTLKAKKDAITSRITEIEDHIKDQSIYLKHYKKRMDGLSKSEKQMRVDEANRYKTYKVEGMKAIKILRKQRSEVRR